MSTAPILGWAPQSLWNLKTTPSLSSSSFSSSSSVEPHYSSVIMWPYRAKPFTGQVLKYARTSVSLTKIEQPFFKKQKQKINIHLLNQCECWTFASEGPCCTWDKQAWLEITAGTLWEEQYGRKTGHTTHCPLSVSAYKYTRAHTHRSKAQRVGSPNRVTPSWDQWEQLH